MKEPSKKNLKLHFIGGVPINILLMLLGLTIIGYWPVSTGLFALKNDAINFFLPYRYSIGEAIRSGNLPYWSPYIYMGHPLNGDIQSGAFNPIVWVLSIFGSYTLTSLHIETLIYLFIGAFGFYKLLSEWEIKPQVAVVISIAYLFCGFYTDNGQNIAWISNAALLPFTFLYFFRILHSGDWKDSLKLALSMSLLLATGYPFFIIYTCYLFLLISLTWIVYQIVTHNKQSTLLFLRQILLAAAVAVVLCAAPLYHFLHMLPYYDRGDGLSLDHALTNSLPPGSLISFLFPWSVSKSGEFLATDMSHLNSFIGVLTLPFIFPGIIHTKGNIRIPLLVILFLNVFLSFGHFAGIREWTYEHLPLMNVFRHPANFRIFTLQILLFFAAKGLDLVLSSSSGNFRQKSPGLIHIGLIILIIIMVILFRPGNFEFFNNPGSGDLRQSLKNFQSSIGFNETIFLTGIIQILFLAAGYFMLVKKKTRRYLILFAVNLIAIAQLTIFTTFVSKSSIKDFENSISYRQKFPIPNLEDHIIQNDTTKTLNYPPGLKHVFNKTLVIQEDFTNPSYLRSYASFTTDKKIRKHLNHYPAAYLADKVVSLNAFNDTNHYERLQIAFMDSADIQFSPASPLKKKMISVNQFGPNRFEFSVVTDAPTYFCLFQNWSPDWRALINGKPVHISQINRSFIGIPLPGGNHQITIVIRNKESLITYILSFASILTCCVILFMKKK